MAKDSAGMAQMERGTVVCDLDGTLVDSAPDLADALDELLTERGLEPIGLDGTRKLIGHGITNLVRKGLALQVQAVPSDVLEAAAARFLELYAKRLPAKATLYPGVAHALETLKADRWRLVVCTNKLEAFSRSILQGLKIAHLFDVIAGPDTYGVAKPDPRHMLLALPAVRAANYKAIAVGDSEVDVATAHAAGLPVIAVTYGYAKTRLADLNPDAVTGSFAEVPQLVRKIIADEGAP